MPIPGCPASTSRPTTSAPPATLSPASPPTSTTRFASAVSKHWTRELQQAPVYNSNPPTSGPHSATPMPFKVLDNPAPKENLVHNMEHGGVVVWYNTDDAGVIDRPGLAGPAPARCARPRPRAPAERPAFHVLRQLVEGVEHAGQFVVESSPAAAAPGRAPASRRCRTGPAPSRSGCCGSARPSPGTGRRVTDRPTAARPPQLMAP